MARGVRKNLVGERFGKLVVKEYKGTDNFRNGLWLCECDCGRVIIEKGTMLTKGNSSMGRVVSCGICSNKFEKDLAPVEEKIDTSLVGKRFGKLVVDEVFYKTMKNGNSRMYAKCKCDCGNKKEILATTLKNGRTLSCGCLKIDKLTNAKFLLSDDFIGKRFGKLVVVDYDTDKKKWKCKCDCGNIKYLMKRNLTNNGYRSCGNCNGKKSRNRRTKEELENDRNKTL